MSSSLPPYTPEFLQRFWLTHGTTGPTHRYDVYTSQLSELSICDILVNDCVFAGFDTSLMYPGTRRSYDVTSANFRALEDQAESVLEEIMLHIYSADDLPSTTSISTDRSKVDILFKYFSLLRYRNSATYADKVHDLSHMTSFPDATRLLEAYNGAFQQVTWRAFFQSMNQFITSDTVKPCGDYPRSVVEDQLEAFCWSILRSADIYIGLTSNEQEFILPDSCFATLDESFTSGHESASNDVFFPITPSLALYFVISEGRPARSSVGMTSIEIDHEAEIDIHLRNAMVLSSTSFDPNMETNQGSKLYFSSLFSITRSILSYEEFRCREGFTDFSRLKQRCRQKYLQTTVTKMLIVKDDVAIIDLSDEVELIGSGAVAFGAFSDVWRGRWYDRMERKERVVAIKFLRQAMAQSMKDKVLRRLQAEVVTWHHLCHRNVAQLFGIVQSPTSIGMVSPWCSNGTIKHYLKDVNPNARRIVLLRQVASGVSYLHGFTPSIVHGDLKGGNILVDRHGFAIITDFGLSKVMSDLGPDFVGSSFFAGSMRWMAPELIEALVSDEDNAPRVTTASDIFAFASVCLEIVTGQLPYQNKKNDQAVMLDIMRRVKPHWGSPGWSERLCEPFIQLLESCWDECPLHRPGMVTVCTILGECEL